MARDPNNKNTEKELELFDHLTELRARLIRIIIYIALGMSVAWMFFNPMYNLLLHPAIFVLNKTGGKFLQTTFAQGFTLRVQVSLIGGIVLAAPLWTTEFWLFIAPGLTGKERKVLYLVGPLSVLLFVMGVAMTYFIMPHALDWFVSMTPPNTELRPDISRTLIFIVQMYLAFGLAFELPVVLMFLGKIGLINSRMMVQYWRESTVGIAIVAAVVTPSNDPLSMTMMAVPMVMLYFLSIALVKWVEP